MEKDLKNIEIAIEELKEMIQRLSEKQNAQFTELMNEIRRVGDNIESNDEDFHGYGLSDDMYEEAKKVVIKYRKASTSLIQRKLNVGYSRAAALIDALEDNGVIGPGIGSKPREILIEE